MNVSTAGSIATTPVDYKQDVFQLSDTLTWNKNSHVMKAGFDMQDYHFDGFSFSRYGGTFRFRNVQEFLTLQRSATAQADRFTGNLPGTDTFREMRQKYAAFFVQDDWRASSHLSIQAGLRYDFVTDPKELNGKVAGLLSLDDLNTRPDGITSNTSSSSSGSLLVASHDRAFLDATVDRVWELRDRRLTAFRGDYSAYHRQRVERDARAVKDVDTQAEQIAREKELIQRYRSHRKFSKQHEHEARLERLEAERREAPRASRKLAIPTTGLVGGAGPSRSGEIVVRLEDLAVGYLPGRGATAPDGSIATEAKIVARAPFLAAQRGERIGIVGPNGAGKTTLLRTIAGDLPPLDGTIAFGNAVQIGYLAQLRSAAIAGATVLDALLEAAPVTAGEARAYLARFLFRGDDAFKEVRLLSGGERSRLELALLGIQPSNLLLLDEPTNHLDIPAREAIEAFMAGSPATLLVVSHDRRLLETVCDKLWVVGDGSAVAFDGGYREWRAAVAGGWTVAGGAGDGGRPAPRQPPPRRSSAPRSLRRCA